MLAKYKTIFALSMFLFFGFVNNLSTPAQAQASCVVCVELNCDDNTINCNKMFALVAIDDQVKPISVNNNIECSNIKPGKHFVAIIFSDAPGPDQIKGSNKIDFEIKSGETLQFKATFEKVEKITRCLLVKKIE